MLLGSGSSLFVILLKYLVLVSEFREVLTEFGDLLFVLCLIVGPLSVDLVLVSLLQSLSLSVMHTQQFTKIVQQMCVCVLVIIESIPPVRVLVLQVN